MDGIVTFSEAQFLMRYPQFSAFATATPGRLQMLFDDVTLLYINNTPSSYVRDVKLRELLIYLVMAHILQISGVLTPAGAGSTGSQVGRVSSATEGSVSASLDMGSTSANAAWWLQSQYGAEYWNATARFRTFRYAAAPSRCRHGR